jgi:hypothetical protein
MGCAKPVRRRCGSSAGELRRRAFFSASSPPPMLSFGRTSASSEARGAMTCSADVRRRSVESMSFTVRARELNSFSLDSVSSVWVLANQSRVCWHGREPAYRRCVRDPRDNGRGDV